MVRQTLGRYIRGATTIAGISAITALLLVAMTGVAGASPVPYTGSGILNGGGYSVQVLANSCINFFNGNTPDACGGNDTYSVGTPTDTSVYTVGGTGGQKDLSFGATLPIVAFLTTPGPMGTVTFDLTSVVIPNAVPCPPSTIPGACSQGVFTFLQSDLSLSGSACPPGASPCGDVAVQFSIFANAYLGSSGTGVTPYKITWTSQFTNETSTDLIAKSSTPGGITDSVSFTATPLPVSTIPEPAAFLLVGGGLLGISLVSRRVRKSRA